MTAVTINGNAYSDDGSQSRDMRFGGHQTWLLPMLQDTMTEVEAATDAAVSADSSAAAALASATNAANYAAALNGTSTSANDIGTGSKTWTTQTGKQFGVGGYVQVIRQSDTTMWMIGQVTAYNTGTGSITVNVEDSNGAGNYSGWDIRVSGKRGAQGTQGNDGTISIPNTDKVAGFTAVLDEKGYMYRCDGTFTVEFAAAATLGSGWFCYVWNAGTGDITLDPNGAETVDGLSSLILYPGAVRQVYSTGSALRTIAIVGGKKKFTTSGSYVMPSNLAAIDVSAVGPGGGGASGDKVLNPLQQSSTDTAGGGGGGARVDRRVYDIPPGTSVTVTVPSGGAGASGFNTLSGVSFSNLSYTNSYTITVFAYVDSLKYVNGKLLFAASASAFSGKVVDIFTSTWHDVGNVRCIAGDGTTYVCAGGNSAEIWSGTSLGSLTARTVPAHNGYSSADYCAGLDLFAVGSLSGQIATSPDGTTWTAQTSPFTGGIYHIANNGTYFIAVGDSGQIAKSTDGITWTLQTSGTTNTLVRARWSSTLSLWVVTGMSSTVRTSTDGVTWATRTYGGTSTNLVTLIELNGTFYASAPVQGNMRSSTDGTTWTTTAVTPLNFGVGTGGGTDGTNLYYVKLDVSGAGNTYIQTQWKQSGSVGSASGATSFGGYVSAAAGAGGQINVAGVSGNLGAGRGGVGNYAASVAGVGTGGAGGYPNFTTLANGGAIGTSGSDGSGTTDSNSGGGGGGGGSSITGNAGNGGNGAAPGGGGGGGGGTNGTGAASSGNGGNGGRGEVVVTEVV